MAQMPDVQSEPQSDQAEQTEVDIAISRQMLRKSNEGGYGRIELNRQLHPRQCSC